MTIKNLFILLLTVLLGFAPKSALADEKWESAFAGPFALGYWSKMDPGATSVATAAASVVSSLRECESKYGVGQCWIQFKSSTDINYYDKLPNGKDRAMEGGLVGGRVAVLKEAVDAIDHSIMQYAATDVPLLDRKDGHRHAWAVITKKIGAVAISYGCNNGKDDDKDGLIDMGDPGCESPTDNDEWNAKPIPAKADDRWAGLLSVVDIAAATPCPVTITGYWALEPKSEGGDGEYHFTHHVDHPYCPKECRTGDVSDKPGFQMMSPKGIAQVAKQHPDPIKAAIAGTSGGLTWTQLRTHIEAPERAPGIEYVDATGAEDKDMWYGRAADIQDDGDVITITFKSICEDLIIAENRQEYGGLDWIASVSGDLGVLAIGTGDYMAFGPIGAAHVEGGFEVGSPDASFIATIGAGHTWYCSDWMNDAWDGQLRLGFASNRSGAFGLYGGGRIAYSVTPSVAVVDHEGDNDETEEVEDGYITSSEALGPNAFKGTVEVGPRFSLTDRGVKHGFVAVTATATSDMRWMDPDGDGLTTKGVGVDFGVALWIGTEF